MDSTVLVALIGICGTLAGAIVGFLGNLIIEKKKAQNDGKLYISKAQYDMETSIYRDLSKKIFHLVVTISTLYSDNHYKESNEKKSKRDDVKDYIEVVNYIADVQDILYENAPFIPEKIYKQYEELFVLARDQFWIYQKNTVQYISGEIPEKVPADEETKERVDKMDSIMKHINEELRQYLQSLSVIDRGR